MNKEYKNINESNLLKILKRVVPGTTSTEYCKDMGYCNDSDIRKCQDMRKLCIICFEDSEKVIGGIAFPFNMKIDFKLASGTKAKNPIVVYRYGQSDGYMTGIEGKDFNDMLSKLENEPVIKKITEKTQFLIKEKKEAEIASKIEAFKRSDIDILTVRKDKKTGEYEEIDKRLIEIAKEKEKKTGKKIKIVDESEITKTIYLLGIGDEKLINKLELEAKLLNDVDERIMIMIAIGNVKYNENYVGVVAITSIEDDILGRDTEKDRLKNYLLSKYGGIREKREGLQFICKERFQ
jgi:hypothetical protein